MRAKLRVRFSKRLPLILITGLLTVGLGVVEVVPASAGPTAGVAKKKCTKKKRKKHKCGDPAAALKALFAGSSFSSKYGDARFTSADEYKFCRSGTYQARFEETGTLPSGLPYQLVATWGGTWMLTNAERAGTYALKATLEQTIDSYQSNVPADFGLAADPHVAQNPPPSPDIQTVVAPFAKPIFTIGGDHPVWTRAPGGAGC